MSAASRRARGSRPIMFEAGRAGGRGLTALLARRREGNLAAALAQSMALAVAGTAGAYPSWVLVSGRDTQVLLGASWVVNKAGPAPGSPLLGPHGAPLMRAAGLCCLLGALTGSLALTLDFLGWRRGRAWAPLLHGSSALLAACAAALGFGLLEVVGRRARAREELRGHGLSAAPGQGLFLALLAAALAAAAAAVSFRTPAPGEPPRAAMLRELRFLPSRREPGEPAGASAEGALPLEGGPREGPAPLPARPGS